MFRLEHSVRLRYILCDKSECRGRYVKRSLQSVLIKEKNEQKENPKEIIVRKMINENNSTNSMIYVCIIWSYVGVIHIYVHTYVRDDPLDYSN